MSAPPDPVAVVAAWLEEGPFELPESTRRAIAVDVRTTRQSRRSIWTPLRPGPMDRASLVAAAVLALAVAGLAASVVQPSGGGNVGGPPPPPPASPSPSPSEVPSAAPVPTTLVIPVMSESYVSRLYGYSVRYPAGWSREGASEPWSPPDWAAGSPGRVFDYIAGGKMAPRFRAASAPLPADLPNTNDWIDEFLTFGDPDCVPPRERQELITIDAAPGRVRDSCGEIEATIVLEGRVYMFTLFLEGDPVTNGRELFDAFAATIDLRPEDAAVATPGP